MACKDGHVGSPLSTPSQDRNIQTPAAQATGTANAPIPADHEQQTPEFLRNLIQEVNKLRQEQSELYAKMYPMSPPNGPPAKPPYEELEEMKRLDREYDMKIGALRAQIQELSVLLAKKADSKPELGTMVGPTGPASPEPAES